MATDTVMRRFRLRQPARFLLRTVPFWIALFVLGGMVVAVAVVGPRINDPLTRGAAWFDVASIVLFYVAVGLYTRMYGRTAREAALLDTGEVELRGVFGARQRLTRDDVEDVRLQQFLPQPGYARLMTHARVWYLGPFEDRRALFDALGVQEP